MKGNIIILAFTLMTINACVFKSDYEKLKNEKFDLEIQIQETKKELSDISDKYDKIIEEKRRAEIESNRVKSEAEIKMNNTPYITESEAKRYI